LILRALTQIEDRERVSRRRETARRFEYPQLNGALEG
jgi:hypothetical protein